LAKENKVAEESRNKESYRICSLYWEVSQR